MYIIIINVIIGIVIIIINVNINISRKEHLNGGTYSNKIYNVHC